MYMHLPCKGNLGGNVGWRGTFNWRTRFSSRSFIC